MLVQCKLRIFQKKKCHTYIFIRGIICLFKKKLNFFFLRKNLVTNLNRSQWLLIFNKRILNRVVAKLCPKIIIFFIVLFLFFTNLASNLVCWIFLLEVNCEFFYKFTIEFFIFLNIRYTCKIFKRSKLNSYIID